MDLRISLFPLQLLIQVGVQESSGSAWGSDTGHHVRRSAALCGHTALHECVFLLPSGSGIRTD